MRAAKARICCVVVAACRCGETFKGCTGKQNFTTHAKTCHAGKAPVPAID